MIFWDNIRYIYYYMRGVTNFYGKKYGPALLFFKKAIPFDRKGDEKILYQYMGQASLVLNQIEDSFFYLSKSYKIYGDGQWTVHDKSELHLIKETLKALKHLDDNYGLRIDGIDYNRAIQKEF